MSFSMDRMRRLADWDAQHSTVGMRRPCSRTLLAAIVQNATGQVWFVQVE